MQAHACILTPVDLCASTGTRMEPDSQATGYAYTREVKGPLLLELLRHA